MGSNEFWLSKIKRDGIRLVVEIDLSFDEFRKMMERSLGYELSDDDVYSLWEIANRRILPPDSGSFSGIGSDVGECVRRDIATDQLPSETPEEESDPLRYVPEVMKCIKAIESIYASIGRAMYDEPRDRLAQKINTLIHRIIRERESCQN